MTRKEIESTVQAAFDGTLDETDADMLRRALKSDSSARAIYFEHARIHHLLSYRFSRIQPLDTAKSIGFDRLKSQTRRQLRFALTSAAALILTLALIFRLILVRDAPAFATFEVDAGSRYSLETHATPADTAAANELLKGTRVSLHQGSIELHIRNGSRAIVLAPAVFHLESEDELRLEEGTAWFEIGDEAKGFKVTTGDLAITDLGTQFGVMATQGSSHEVHVFSGKVIARGMTYLPTEETLTTGMARMCDPVGRLKAVSLRPESFLTKLPTHSESGIVINGDFETGNPPPARTYGISASASLLPGWLFGSDITVVRATNEGRPGYGEKEITILSSTGDVQVGFNSDTAVQPEPGDVSLWQTLPTTPGMTYEVRFEMGAITFNASTMEVTAAVYSGLLPESLERAEPLARHAERRQPEAGNGYNPPTSFLFTATSSITTLVFTETSPNSTSADPVIDNVSVRPVD